jgi:hypothetical protein
MLLINCQNSASFGLLYIHIYTYIVSIIVYNVCIYYNKHVVLPSNGACNNKLKNTYIHFTSYIKESKPM